MRADLKEYARIGLVHHLLYPHSLRSPAEHLDTLGKIARRNDIETLDCCLPFEAQDRREADAILRNCGKEIVYALHLLPLRKISLGSICPHEQAVMRLLAENQVEAAASAGARAVIFSSGADVNADERPSALRAFADFCRWFCRRLKQDGLTALLEPFDRTADKKFLYGATRDCLALVEALRPDADNFGIELDIAHLPLMGEDFDGAIRTVAPCLRRVHLGNCLMRDPSHPWFGDHHPPIGFPGGEIDVPQLVTVLRALIEIGYLNRQQRGALVLEMRPFPDRTAEETVRDTMQRLQDAWRKV